MTQTTSEAMAALLRPVARYWWVVVLLALGAAGLGAALASSGPARYEAQVDLGIRDLGVEQFVAGTPESDESGVEGVVDELGSFVDTANASFAVSDPGVSVELVRSDRRELVSLVVGGERPEGLVDAANELGARAVERGEVLADQSVEELQGDVQSRLDALAAELAQATNPGAVAAISARIDYLAVLAERVDLARAHFANELIVVADRADATRQTSAPTSRVRAATVAGVLGALTAAAALATFGQLAGRRRLEMAMGDRLPA